MKKSVNIETIINKQWIFLIIILIVTFFVYSSVLNFEFIKWDDDKQITNNPYIKTINEQNIVHNLHFERFTFIPLTIYSVIYYFKGINSFPFHLLNVIFHLLNIVLVYFLSRKILQNIPLALFIAMLFALHPMRVESVAWVSELKDMLFTFFSLLTYLVYIKYVNNEKRTIFLLFAFLLIILASFSKIQGLLIAPTLILFDVFYDRKISILSLLEKIIIFILVLFVLNMTFLFFMILFMISFFVVKKWIVPKIKVNKKVVNISVIVLCAGILAFIIYFVSNNAIDLWSNAPDKRNVFSLYERFFLAGYALFFYFSNFLIPVNLNAVHPYPQRLLDGSLPFEYYFASFVLIVAIIISIYCILKRKKVSKIVFFGWFFFLVNISMVLHIIPIEGRLVAADRYSYLAYFGLFVIVAFFIQKYILQNQKIKNLFLVFFPGIMFLLAVSTYSRTLVWKNTLTLFEDVLKKSPDIPFAYLNVGGTYLNNRLPANALIYFNRSIKLDSLDPSAYFNRALAYFMSGKSDSAICDFNKVIQLSKAKSDIALVYTNMGEVYHKTGNDSLAIKYYLKSIETDSSIAASYNNIGMYYFQERDLSKASFCFTKAVELDPDYADAWNNRGWVMSILGNVNDAMKCFDNSLALNPAYAMALNNRGYLKFKINDVKGSLNDYNQALKIDSSLTEAYLNRGWIYSSTGNFQLAASDYSYVLNKIKNHQTALTNRAFAWFYMNDFKKAVTDFEDAVKYFPGVAVNHQNLGWFKLQMKEYDSAINEFNEAVKLDSTLTNSYLNLGWVWLEKGNIVKAEKNLNKVINLSPQNGEAFFLLGELFRKNQKLSIACKYYSEAQKYGNKQANSALDRYCE